LGEEFSASVRAALPIACLKLEEAVALLLRNKERSL
jgi:hypothetical protein